MSKIVIFIASILLLTPCFAQTQGFLPQLVEGYQDQTPSGSVTPGVIIVPENINVGDLLVVAGMQDVAHCGDGPFPISDTLASTWHTLTLSHTSSGNTVLEVAWTVASSSGADTITVAFSFTTCFQQAVYGRFKNTSGFTLDTQTSNQSDSPFGAGTNTTSNTTNVNGDICIAAWTYDYTSTAIVLPGTNNLVSTEAENGLMQLSYKRGGAPGTVSQTTPFSAAKSQQIGACFKPATIFVGTSALPDAVSGGAYSAQLTCAGGILAPTYAVASGSLPTGITLTGATGVLTATNVTGTTQTVGFTCTDGTTTSATQSLTLKVGSAFFTPTIIQSTPPFDTGNTGQTYSTSAPNHCGSLLILAGTGCDTHGGNGWVCQAGGTNNNVQDSFGSPVQLVTSITGAGSGPSVFYVIGPLTQSGIDVVTVHNNAGAASLLSGAYLVEISGAQGVVDEGAINSAFVSGGSGSISASYASPVPNEMLLVASNSSNSGTMGFSAPFNLLQQFCAGGCGSPIGIIGSASIAAASTTTATTSISGTVSPPVSLNTLVAGFRPALTANGCSAFTGQGEKYHNWQR